MKVARDHMRKSRSRSRESSSRNFHSPKNKNSNEKSVKLHVSKIPKYIDERALADEFQKFGKVQEVLIIRKNQGQQLKDFYFGFVKMTNTRDADKAMIQINSDSKQRMRVSFSKESRHEYRDKSYRRGYKNRRKKSGRDSSTDRNSQRRSRSSYHSHSSEEEKSKDSTRPYEKLLVNLSKSLGEPNAQQNLIQLLNKPNHELNQITQNIENIQSQFTGNLLVRELWVGNLNESITEIELRQFFEEYGTIEKIEFFKKQSTQHYSASHFAFLRYEKVSQATSAFENIWKISKGLNCNKMKISFADHQRRVGIVGDNIKQESDIELLPILYVGYSITGRMPDESYLRETFSKYGKVILVKCSRHDRRSGLRSFAFIEYKNLDATKHARKKMFLNDGHGDRRRRIGDSKLEITVLVKKQKKFKPLQKLQIQQRPNLGQVNGNYHPSPQLIRRNSAQRSNMQMQFPPQQMFQRQIPNNRMNMNINPNQQQIFRQQPIRQGQNFIPNGQQNPRLNFPNVNMFPRRIPHPNQRPNMLPQYRQPQMNQNHQFQNINRPPAINNIVQKQPTMQNRKQSIKSNISDSQILNLADDKEFLQLVKHGKNDYKSHDHTNECDHDNEDTQWSGFFTRNKKNRVGVDAKFLAGKEHLLEDYGLNISHRSNYQEVLSKPYSEIAIFWPSNKTCVDKFKEYIKYFTNKKRAGVVNLKNYMLYLIPPGETANKIYKIGQNQILGIFVSQQDIKDKKGPPVNFCKENNISLPVDQRQSEILSGEKENLSSIQNIVSQEKVDLFDPTLLSLAEDYIQNNNKVNQ